jgi:hypothetical protein
VKTCTPTFLTEACLSVCQFVDCREQNSLYSSGDPGGRVVRAWISKRVSLVGDLSTFLASSEVKFVNVGAISPHNDFGSTLSCSLLLWSVITGRSLSSGSPGLTYCVFVDFYIPPPKHTHTHTHTHTQILFLIQRTTASFHIRSNSSCAFIPSFDPGQPAAHSSFRWYVSGFKRNNVKNVQLIFESQK